MFLAFTISGPWWGISKRLLAPPQKQTVRASEHGWLLRADWTRLSMLHSGVAT